MQLFEVFYKIPITDNLGQLIGWSDSKSAYIVAVSYNDSQNELLSKLPGSKIEYNRKIADINGFSSESMDYILMKNCESYRKQKSNKSNKLYDNTIKQNKGSILSKVSKG